MGLDAKVDVLRKRVCTTCDLVHFASAEKPN